MLSSMKPFYCLALFAMSLLPGRAWAIIDITSIKHQTSSISLGSIDVTAEGNAGPFTFQWSNGATTEDVFNLQGGMYTVTVTNKFGCTKVLNANVINCELTAGQYPPIMLINGVPTPISGVGASDGAINLTVGGFHPYYKWKKQGSNAVFSASEDLTNLSAGVYCVTITGDCAATEITACYPIVACTPDLWTINPTVKNDCDCSKCTFCEKCAKGYISLNFISAPSGPKKYMWSTGATTNDAQDLSAGNYAVTITDVTTSCTTTRSFTLGTDQVVVTKTGGCTWAATCGGKLVQYYTGPTELKLEYRKIEDDGSPQAQGFIGEWQCVNQQYCDDKPVPHSYSILGPPETEIDWDFCRAELVCKTDFDELIVGVYYGQEDIDGDGSNCRAASVECTIELPNGPISHTTYDAIDWTYCRTSGLDQGQQCCSTWKYCEDNDPTANYKVLVSSYCDENNHTAYLNCIDVPACPFGITPSVNDRSPQKSDQMDIYLSFTPNPFKDHFFLNYVNLPKGIDLEITLLDVYGNISLFEKSQITENTGSIAFNTDPSLPPGSYIAVVRSKDSGISFQTKMIKIGY